MASIYTGLVAFFEEHRRCGVLDIGGEGELVWIRCAECGAVFAHVAGANTEPPVAEHG